MTAKGGNVALAVLLASMAAFLGAVDAAIVRSLGGEVHPFIIAFFRATFGALAVLPLVIRRPSVLRSTHPLRQHAMRAGLKLLALIAFFAAFARGPLTDVTAIAFTSPIFVVLGATVMLGERLTRAKIAAAALGFMGAMLIVGPAGSGPSLAIGLALSGAALTALIQLMLKSMSSGDRTDTLVVLNLLLSAPIALLIALPVWDMPDRAQFGLLALQGVLGAANMALMTHAMSLADASVVAPVDFLRLPLVALVAWLVFAETAAATTWAGGAIICAAALLASRGR
ncbi:DMT family transporter [Falsirhodobacter xinxiangensis]|uniref:DMT family transporter n=1 Tax=Falsirhodobacter xinxiangensis TaxID=2530049 RepID=UPI0010AB1475|nr:DMT family transporter [Rhodobacter xinxiangensis]